MTNSKESRLMTEHMGNMRLMRAGKAMRMPVDEIDDMIRRETKGKPPRKEPKKR